MVAFSCQSSRSSLAQSRSGLPKTRGEQTLSVAEGIKRQKQAARAYPGDHADGPPNGAPMAGTEAAAREGRQRRRAEQGREEVGEVSEQQQVQVGVDKCKRPVHGHPPELQRAHHLRRLPIHLPPSPNRSIAFADDRRGQTAIPLNSVYT